MWSHEQAHWWCGNDTFWHTQQAKHKCKKKKFMSQFHVAAWVQDLLYVTRLVICLVMAPSSVEVLWLNIRSRCQVSSALKLVTPRPPRISHPINECLRVCSKGATIHKAAQSSESRLQERGWKRFWNVSKLTFVNQYVLIPIFSHAPASRHARW